MRRVLAAVAVAVVFAALHASPAEAAEPALAAPPGPVAWRPSWRRFTAAEAFATIGMTAGAWIVEREVEPREAPRIEGPVPLLDAGVRGLLRGRSARAQATAERLSDVGFRTLALFPYVMDAGVVALGVHRSPEVAAQMALIDAEALTANGLTQLLVSRLVGRPRPYEGDCRAPGDQLTWRVCAERPDTKSFYSGHASAAFTSAGLVCLHHQFLPLYGGGAPDAWACTWALGVASATAALRVSADAHWASDVLVGAGVGWLHGYVVPRFLHYGAGPVRRSTSGTWLPTFTPSHDGGVVGVTGAF